MADRTARQRLESWEGLLGLRIREERQRLGMSQSELAERMASAGFSTIQTTIAKIEAGNRPLRISEFVGVANALGIPWQSLLAGQASMLDERDPLRDMENRLSAAILLEDDALRELTTEISVRAAEFAQLRASREALAQEFKRMNEGDHGTTTNTDQ